MVTVDQGAASVLGVVGSAVSLLAAIPHARAIYRRGVRPHLFTWRIWSVVTAIAVAGQLVAGAGPSAWCMAAIALTCFLTFVACLFLEISAEAIEGSIDYVAEAEVMVIGF